MGMSATGTGVVKPHDGSCSGSKFPEKPLPTACAVAEKEKEEWLIAGRVRGKHQTVWSQSLEAPSTKGTLSPTHSTSIKGDAPSSGKTSFQDLQRKYDIG